MLGTIIYKTAQSRRHPIKDDRVGINGLTQKDLLVNIANIFIKSTVTGRKL